ncbi:unnamed protein product [Protopolystoma xenopodis]|uniref:Uncharacterized protein n=1 Tax=Protopolystoma xenopodis TaxID=117903 RepID=A0A3S5FG24_9PLAT|nr:unnamed protein product [Protopolystoma xenopodis]
MGSDAYFTAIVSWQKLHRIVYVVDILMVDPGGGLRISSKLTTLPAHSPTTHSSPSAVLNMLIRPRPEWPAMRDART